jgi:hypothetical protein
MRGAAAMPRPAQSRAVEKSRPAAPVSAAANTILAESATDAMRHALLDPGFIVSCPTASFPWRVQSPSKAW